MSDIEKTGISRRGLFGATAGGAALLGGLGASRLALLAGTAGLTATAAQAEGTSFVIVEHNMDMIAALCEPVYVLAQGRVLTQGRFDEVVAHEAVAEAYLGGTP